MNRTHFKNTLGGFRGATTSTARSRDEGHAAHIRGASDAADEAVPPEKHPNRIFEMGSSGVPNKNLADHGQLINAITARFGLIYWFGYAITLLGCGVQIGTGAHFHSPNTSWPESLVLSSRMHLVRESGLFAGGDIEFSDPSPQSSFGLRHLRFTSGYRALLSDFSLEVGPELGLGAPAFQLFPATGMYTGASAAVLYRLSGQQDKHLGFAPAAALFDIVLTSRGGFWTAPYGSGLDPFWDASVALGLRLTLISDLAVANSTEWETR